MSQRLKVDSVWNVLTTNNREAIVATRPEVRRTVTRSKAFPRIWSLVGCVTEFVVGVLAVFYFVAALALGAALLFFTFCH
jgi:hypothetical protein